MKNLDKNDVRKALRKARAAWKRGERYYDKKHNTYHPASRVESVLEHTSDLLGLYGVLAYSPGDDNPTHPEYQYINAGDSYALTVVHEKRTGKFLLTDIGGVIEREEYSL